MTHIAVLGAGITGVTTAYALVTRGYDVTVFDRHPHAAMETSYANGGQLSVCNAEVWNNTENIVNGLKWLLRKDAPLKLNLKPSCHKYTWLAEFIKHIRDHKANTMETARLALAAREPMYRMAEDENIQFDLEKRGILHVYHNAKEYEIARKANTWLTEAGLERNPVTSEEIKSIEPSLQGEYYAGFYTPSDATGDIFKFCTGLTEACKKRGVIFEFDAEVSAITPSEQGTRVDWHQANAPAGIAPEGHSKNFDGFVLCAGVGSKKIAKSLGDRINIYPVKGYSITVHLNDKDSQNNAPYVSLLDEEAKIVTSRLGNDRLRVAGTAEFNGYSTDIRTDRIRPLIDWTRRHFNVNVAEVTPWAGLRPMTPNMMPRVGQGKHERVFYNTGHGHLGWTLGAATAEMVATEIEQALPVG